MKKVLFGFLGFLFILFTLNSCSSDDGKYCYGNDTCITLDDGNFKFQSPSLYRKGTYEIDGQKITFTPDDGGRSYDGELDRNNNKLMMGQTPYKKVK